MGIGISFLFSFFLSFLSGSQIYDPTEFQDKFYPHEQRKEREKIFMKCIIPCHVQNVTLVQWVQNFFSRIEFSYANNFTRF